MGNISVLIICGLITLFTLFLIIVHIISDVLTSFPCFFNIYFCLIIIFDNAIRLIPADKNQNLKNASNGCKAQAFILSFFDKLFIVSITSYSIINYLIMINTPIYENHRGKIYIILVFISICLSLGLTFLFFFQGLSESSLKNGGFCYVKTDVPIKRIADSIFTAILLLIDLFCSIRVLLKIKNTLKDYQLENNHQKLLKFRKHFRRFLFDFFLNIITFGYIICIINKWLNFLGKNNIKDILFIFICLINELFFTINEESFKEIMRIITCNKVEKFKSNRDNNLLPIEQDDAEEEEE